MPTSSATRAGSQQLPLLERLFSSAVDVMAVDAPCYAVDAPYHAGERPGLLPLAKRGPSITLRTNVKCSAIAFLPTPHVFGDSRRGKGRGKRGPPCPSCVCSLPAPRHGNFFAVAKGNMYTLADRVRVFTLKGENVGQEGFYTRVGHGSSPFAPAPNGIYARSGRVSPGSTRSLGRTTTSVPIEAGTSVCDDRAGRLPVHPAIADAA